MEGLLNAQQLKETASLVDLLSRLGHKPVRRSGNEQYYISMLRDSDKNASLSVNDELGVWFDHGMGKGGNIIDFGMAYWENVPFKEVLERLQGGSAVHRRERISRAGKAVKVPNYLIEEVKALGSHPVITSYLEGRGIYDAAQKHLSEIYYFVKDEKGLRKHFFSAGWKNESGSWQVRNKYFKGCLGAQDISFIPGDSKRVAIFEGFLNYLSWLTEHPDNTESVIVLNSIVNLKAGIGKAQLFSSIDVFFDRDEQGHKAAKNLINALPYASDRSLAYDGFNDYNDKLMAGLREQTESLESEKRRFFNPR